MLSKTLVLLLGSLAFVAPAQAVAQGSLAVSSTAGSTGSSAARAKLLAVDVSIGPPGAVTVDQFGAVYFSRPNLVLKLDTQGFLSRVAGSDADGNSGDGGPATQALLSFPSTYPELENDPIDFGELVAGLAVDDAGNLYIADAYNDQVRKVDSNGAITTIMPPAPWPAKWPQGVATDSMGSLYISYAYGQVVKRLANGTISTLAVPDCGADLTAGFCGPGQIALDSDGNIYVPDGYCRVRKIAPDDTIVTIAGYEGTQNYTWQCGFSGDGGPALNAYLAWPYAVAVDTHGNVFIADTYNHCIRKVDSAGTITTFAGTCEKSGFSGDGGSATAASLSRPHGVAVDAVGNVYIADTGNNRIRKVSSDGLVTTIAGNGIAESFRDQIPTASVIEYYNETLDHYFITASPAEIDGLDSGRVSGWKRTGESFVAWIARASADGVNAPAGLRNVCRIYIQPAFGDSHFFSGSAEECAASIAQHPGLVMETDAAFLVTLPDMRTGECSYGQTPLYRTWNARTDSGHRYTTSIDVRNEMVASGHIAEGSGPDAVAMCVAGSN